VSTIDRDAGRFGATLTLAAVIFKKQLVLMLRYPINLLSGLLTMYRRSRRLPWGRSEIEDFRDDETRCVSNHLTPG
jgi:hypothetical protein